MNRKILIILGVSVFIISTTTVAISMATAESEKKSCRYTEDGYYISPKGEISAFGTMDHAAKCAAKGELPSKVHERLGQWGSKDRANAILQINLDAQTKKINE